MCLSCGCKIVYWDHDNPDNFTLTDLREASVAGDVESMDKVVKNIKKAYKLYTKGKITNLFGPPPDDDDDDDGDTVANSY